MTSDKAGEVQKCRWLQESEAFRFFASSGDQTESARHIKPLHWYVACRLVLEGGFDPKDITPHPPFVMQRRGKRLLLNYAPEAAKAVKQQCSEASRRRMSMWL